jgi:hypothetical protein
MFICTIRALDLILMQVGQVKSYPCPTASRAEPVSVFVLAHVQLAHVHAPELDMAMHQC